MLRVGLTGGIGSGKSEVSRLLVDHGAVVIDADVLAREVVAPGTDGLREIVDEFGPGVLTVDGALDRSAMGKLVFDDHDARRRLEQIVHPRVRAHAAEIEASARPGAVVVHDIPLLVETGQADDFDVVIVVDAPPDLQRARLVDGRGMDAEEAQDRIAAQATRTDRRAAADIVITNDGSLADLEASVRQVWDRLTSGQP